MVHLHVAGEAGLRAVRAGSEGRDGRGDPADEEPGDHERHRDDAGGEADEDPAAAGARRLAVRDEALELLVADVVVRDVVDDHVPVVLAVGRACAAVGHGQLTRPSPSRAPVHAAPASGAFGLFQYLAMKSLMRWSSIESTFTCAPHADSAMGVSRPSYGDMVT